MRKFYLLFFCNFLLCASGCFTFSPPSYPENWPTLITTTDKCPDLSGIYSANTQEFIPGQKNQDIRIGPLSLNQLGVCADKNSFFCENDKLFIINQKTCDHMEFSEHFSVTDWKASKNISFTIVKPAAYNSNYIEFRSNITSSGGKFELITNRKLTKYHIDSSGALVKNIYSYVCGFVVFPPLPICYGGYSDKWYRNERIFTANTW